MRPTTTQKEICELIIRQAKAWRDTNDISSPSHYTYIEEELEKLMTLHQNDIDHLFELFSKLLTVIKNNK